MTLRPLLLLVAATLVAAVCAALVMPARWLIHSTPAHAPLAVVDASGSLWRGQAVLALGPAGLQRTLPDPLRWHWRWQWGARPMIVVTHPWLTGPLLVAPGATTLHFGAQGLRLPASALALAGSPFNSMEPGGQLQVSWPAFEWGGAPHVGPLLQIQWNDASAARVRVRPLGNFTAAVTGQADRTLALRVTTQSGALRIQGSGTLAPGGRWQFEGVAQAASTADQATQDALTPLLAMLGQRQGGITTLHYQ